MSISWSLRETTSYTAGTALQGVLYMSSPGTGSITGYVLGTLLTQTGVALEDALFHLRWDGQKAVAAPGWTDPYIWIIPPPPLGGYALEAPFSFAFARSDVWLRLTLYHKAGIAADPETDPILGQVMTWLATPPSLMDQMMPVIAMAMAMAILGMLMREFK